MDWQQRDWLGNFYSNSAGESGILDQNESCKRERSKIDPLLTDGVEIGLGEKKCLGEPHRSSLERSSPEMGDMQERFSCGDMYGERTDSSVLAMVSLGH